MKKSELISLIKECINEINVKKEKQPVSAQLGILSSDGTVETIRILTGDQSEIDKLLKTNYSTQQKLQTLLDYGDVYKLDVNSNKTQFAERDKKMRGTGSKLKNDMRSFVTVAKNNKASKVYLFDLKTKTWKTVDKENLDSLLNKK